MVKIITEHGHLVDSLVAPYLAPGLFVYVAFNAVHRVLSVPFGYNTTKEFIEMVSGVAFSNPTRQELAGALKIADDAFALILASLSEAGLHNSVVVVVSDNGGSLDDGGNNQPLRGGKKTNFEGGIRVPAFVTGPMIPKALMGSTFSGLFHVSDWLPTLAFGLRGIPVPLGFDGVDQWANILSGRESRVNIVCGMDYLKGIKGGGEEEIDVAAAETINDTSGCVILKLNHTVLKFIWQVAHTRRIQCFCVTNNSLTLLMCHPLRNRTLDGYCLICRLQMRQEPLAAAEGVPFSSISPGTRLKPSTCCGIFLRTRNRLTPYLSSSALHTSKWCQHYGKRRWEVPKMYFNGMRTLSLRGRKR